MTSDIADFIKNCHPCQIHPARFKTVRTPLKSIKPPRDPWTKVGVDLMGPFKKTRRGNTYVLVVKDYLTKFVVVEPLVNAEDDQVAFALYKVCCQDGFPKMYVHDRGGPFCSRLNEHFARWTNLKTIKIRPYHPQANGLVEREIRTLKSILTKVCIGNPEWDLFVYGAALTSNTQRKESLGLTPAEVMFGRKWRVAIDLFQEIVDSDGDEQVVLNANEEASKSSTEPDDPDDHIGDAIKQRRLELEGEFLNALEKRHKKHAEARERAIQKQAKQKAHYDRRNNTTISTIEPGSKVMVLTTPATKKRPKSSLLPKFSGPYDVVEVRNHFQA